FLFLFLSPRLPLRSAFFPYTTLFRSPNFVVLAMRRVLLIVSALAVTVSSSEARHWRWHWHGRHFDVPRYAYGLAPFEDSVQRGRSEEHTSELQSLTNLVCRLLLGKKK